ncbi:DUF2793 domain-containing protein [Sphingomonas sp. RB3P16]|uniref:DUF2793 domain-containing protein n=1 Tax=Parasphingomonas frigoris TaxID=3096163 RepID=UPI002FCB952E
MTGERALPGIGLKGFWTHGSDGWDTENDVNLRLLSATTQLVVASRTTALPGSPTDGMIYITPGTGLIAVRDGGVWVNITPLEGWRAWVKDTKQIVVFDGTVWIGEPVDLMSSVAGRPGASANIAIYLPTRMLNFASGLPGSIARAIGAATSSTVLTVAKNGTTVATITFAAAGVNGSFATSSGAFSAGPGDVLTISAPSSQDATLSDIGITLVANR